MEFYEKLIQLRKEKGISQEQLADLMDVSRQSVSKWESGFTMPEIEKIILLADTFDVTVDYLVRNDISEYIKDITLTDNKQSKYVKQELEEIKESIKKVDLRYEYKSKANILGLPLVHINLSRSHMTVAKGIIAIGNISLGVFSIGIASAGIFTLAPLAFGLLLAFGGFACGAFAFGGGSLGLIAFGGLAVGYTAMGGLAIGYNAMGGIAMGYKLACGGYAIGEIAVGGIVKGTYTLVADGLLNSEIAGFILAHYPNVNKILLTIASTI